MLGLKLNHVSKRGHRRLLRTNSQCGEKELSKWDQTRAKRNHSGSLCPRWIPFALFTWHTWCSVISGLLCWETTTDQWTNGFSSQITTTKLFPWNDVILWSILPYNWNQAGRSNLTCWYIMITSRTHFGHSLRLEEYTKLYVYSLVHSWMYYTTVTPRDRRSVSYHQPLDFLSNRLFRLTMKTSKVRITGRDAGRVIFSAMLAISQYHSARSL